MPPVREASTKPSAATVLPAPVACSNQKRRAAPGSSSTGVAPRPPPRPPRPGPSRAAPRRAARRPRARPRRSGAPRATGASPVAVAADQELGLERDQRAGQRVDLVGEQRRAVGQVRLLLGEQPLEAQHQRELAPPLDRRLARGPRRSPSARRRARRGAALPSASAVAASSPSSTKDSRANFSARFRSSPETGEASATELLSATIRRSSVRRGTCRVARQETAGYARGAPPFS